MIYYKYNNLENGDVLLEKIDIDIVNYSIEHKDNGDVLLKKNLKIVINDINGMKKYNFTKSTINSCIINDTIVMKLKYKSILEKIYTIINNGAKIIKYSKLNIKTIKKCDEGYYYLEKLGISVQCVDSNKCLTEIINQCNINNIKLNMIIKINNNDIININI